MPQTTQRVISLAKRAAVVQGSSSLEVDHFLIACLADAEARELVRKERLGGEREIQVPEQLSNIVARLDGTGPVEAKIPLGGSVKETVQHLYRKNGGLPPFLALFDALLKIEADPVKELLGMNPGLANRTEAPDDRSRSRLARLTEEINGLQNILQRKVIGQRQAIQQIADAIFQARIYGRENENTPRAVLLALGPPGVGKTYTAQLIADNLYRHREGSFLRLDMSSYADRDSYRMLVGFEPSYQGARAGVLTEHVKQYPECVVLIDEVEKAHPAVHNLFLQVLDRGMLEDKFLRENVSFSETIVIFTTNLGRELYTSSKVPGQMNLPVQSREVMEALRSSVNPMTGMPALSPELCSRLAKGYPVLFQHLVPLDLESIAELSVAELALEFEQRLGIRIKVGDDRLLTLMVLKLGPDLDARTVTSGIGLMIKDAFRGVLNEHREELLGEQTLLEKMRCLRIELPIGPEKDFFDSMLEGGNRLLVLTDRASVERGGELAPEFRWTVAGEGSQAVELLRREPADFVLLDLDLHADQGLARGAAAARELRRIRSVFPDLPVYLYSDEELDPHPDPSFVERLVASGGARGFLKGPVSDWETGSSGPLEKIRQALLRERFLREAFRTRQTARFDWQVTIALDDKEGIITLRPRDVHLQTVVASKDRSARLSFTGIPAERLADVAGAREAKLRLTEIIGWMRNPETLRSVGVDVPSGILLEGPPGNGKTLLARATAGEANLPFFAVSATDFASKWVGESESNIRELFERAATYAPSMIFIDEIDAIGSRRSMESSGIQDSMLNQLLVSMDGFSARERPVFFLAATNRSDLLDPALKRPGRFDLIINIDDLDVEARLELLRLKSERLPLAADVNQEEIARASVGMSGAQLTQVFKEAAILALREQGIDRNPSEIVVEQRHLKEALTNVRYGLKREGALPPEGEVRRTAIHEAGHALVAHLERPGSVNQATVLPRGRALGFVESIPENEYGSITAAELRSRMRVALAGRAAEILVYGADGASAGCSQDLEMATRVAAMAVTRYGMSPTAGAISYPVLDQLAPSRAAADRTHQEISDMVRTEEDAATAILRSHRQTLEAMAQALVRHETVDGAQIAAIVDAEQPSLT